MFLGIKTPWRNLIKMEENIIIVDPKNFKEKRAAMISGGPENLHILTDFDMTLTKFFVDGKKFPSMISILRDNNYLTQEYSDKTHELYEKYRPIEIDPHISYEEKKKAMYEWWNIVFDLLIKCGLNKRHLDKATECGEIILRDNGKMIFDLAHDHNIPIVIMSSSGLGVESISIFLEKIGKFYDNIHIVGNSFEWDEEGSAVAVRKPIIHALNKKEIMVKDYPFFGKVENRKNVILMGDNAEDVHMIDGFGYDNLIKIGFLNENIEENMEKYKSNYDVVILNDSPMDFAGNLLEQIIG